MLRLAKSHGSRMTFQDLRHLLRGWENKGFIYCVNPAELTGRLYVRREVALPDASDAEWRLVACLLRAGNRRAVLEEITRSEVMSAEIGKTATQIRKNLRERAPMGLNHILRAIGFLEHQKLIECRSITRKRSLRLLSATKLGVRVSRLVSTCIQE